MIRHMKKVVIFLLSVMILASSAYAIQRRNIKPNQLPQTARTYLQTYLADQSIKQVTEVTDEYRVTYEVYLTNGSLIVFNRDGGWKVISMPDQTVPRDIIPADIQVFLERNYGRYWTVTRIAKVKDGYKVTVNGQELLCNTGNMEHMQNQIDADSVYRSKHEGLSEREVEAIHHKKIVKRRRWLKIHDDGSKERETQDKRVKSNGRP